MITYKEFAVLNAMLKTSEKVDNIPAHVYKHVHYYAFKSQEEVGSLVKSLEEKEYIKKELSKQKDRYKQYIELRKRINREKEIKNAERIDGYRVYALTQMRNELRNKLKIEHTLNKELFDQYYNNFIENVNKDTEVDIYSN